MGKGRAPCCDKTNVKKGPWSPAEDMKLTAFIQKHGHPNWRSLPKQAGLLRCGKSCRLRWVNYLRPDLKRGNFTPKEEQTIIDLHNSIGNKWSKIACHLPGRTDNEIKNVWNTHLKKRRTNKTPSGHKTDEANYSASASCDSSSVTSFGDQNLEKATIDQGFQESEIMKSHENPEFFQLKFTHPHESKDLTCASDSPTSSYASGFSRQSSKNPDDHGKIEIPWEPDIEFWELMDSLDPLQAGKAECDVGTQECCPAEGFDDNGINGMDFSRWIRFLETELGLTTDVVDLQPEQQNVVPTTPPSLDTKLKPEIYPGFDYFPIWPSSPHNLGI